MGLFTNKLGDWTQPVKFNAAPLLAQARSVLGTRVARKEDQRDRLSTSAKILAAPGQKACSWARS
jgi:hypothetical protein